jgi:hypothetical protein
VVLQPHQSCGCGAREGRGEDAIAQDKVRLQDLFTQDVFIATDTTTNTTTIFDPFDQDTTTIITETLTGRGQVVQTALIKDGKREG